MSKSIFIIDTPACCGECPMSCTDVCRKWSRKEARTFPKDCPLKPAYDVDKVVEQLEEMRSKREEQLRICVDNDMADYLRCKMSAIAEVIEIVKSGGIKRNR